MNSQNNPKPDILLILDKIHNEKHIRNREGPYLMVRFHLNDLLWLTSIVSLLGLRDTEEVGKAYF